VEVAEVAAAGEAAVSGKMEAVVGVVAQKEGEVVARVG